MSFSDLRAAGKIGRLWVATYRGTATHPVDVMVFEHLTRDRADRLAFFVAAAGYGWVIGEHVTEERQRWAWRAVADQPKPPLRLLT